MKQLNNMSYTLIGSVFLACSGCTSIGNILFSPHPLSQKFDEPKLIPKSNCTTVHAAGGIDMAIGIALTALQKTLEQEAKQYTASYSATNHFSDMNCLDNLEMIRGVDEEELKKGIEKFTSKVDVKLDKQLPAFRINEGQIQISGVKSKVASWPVLTLIHGQNPWSGNSLSSKIGNTFGFVNPFMLIHSIYGVFDPDIYKVNTTLKIRIDAISLNGNQTDLKNQAEATFPLGKVDIFEIKEEHPWTNVKSTEKGETGYFESGYFPLPIKNKLDGIEVNEFPTNITMTVVEGNDFGDTIGQGAKLIGDKKDDIGTKIKEFFGLK